VGLDQLDAMTSLLQRVRGAHPSGRICFEPGNPASGPLYTSAGFVPEWRSDLFARRR
jgi:hypothetical protein